MNFPSFPFFGFHLPMFFPAIFFSACLTMPRKLVSRRSSFRASQITDQGPGYYIVEEGSVSSSESESASVNVDIRRGYSMMRRIRRKRKREEANADESRIFNVVRQTLSDIVDVIGEN